MDQPMETTGVLCMCFYSLLSQRVPNARLLAGVKWALLYGPLG